MRQTRRQFLAALGVLGVSGCAQLKKIPLDKITPDLSFGDKGPMAVAALNDLHISDARSTAILRRALQQIKGISDLRFLVVLGDVSTSGRLSEFMLAKECFDTAKLPWRCIPGNHDVEVRAVNPYGNYEQTMGARHWIHEEGGWAFIGLDTCVGMSSDVTFPADRMDALRNDLEDIGKEKPIALFTHHPLNPNTKQYRIKNADEILALFSGHTLKLAAAGHYHGNQVEEKDGILFVTTACCSSTRKNFDDTQEKGFRLFRMQDGSISQEFIVVDA